MINVQVIAIDQRYVFGAKGQEVQNYLVLQLPNGVEARAIIDLDTAKELLNLDANNGSAEYVPDSFSAPKVRAAVPVNSSPVQAQEEAHELDVASVEWLKLPDEILEPAMKAAFTHLGMVERLTPVAIRSLEREIMEKFGEEEWAEVLGPEWRAIMPNRVKKALPTPQPPIGKIQWADGSPMISGTGGGSRSKTVPKDNMGYPIVNDGTVDAGEMLGGTDADEDGVGSM